MKAHKDAEKLGLKDVFSCIIEEYKNAPEFTNLSNSSKRAYNSYIRLIEAKFGTMPIAALADLRVRGDFKTWRDSMASTPRKADYAWTTLARIMSFAKDRGRITTNPCERGGKLYTSERIDRIWTDADLARLEAVASPSVWVIVLAALWTGQRQGDLLGLPWSAYDGVSIRLKQGKTGRRVTIPCGKVLRAALDKLPRKSPTMLLNSRSRVWTSVSAASLPL